MKSDGLKCDEQIERFPRHTEANVLIKRALAQIVCSNILEPNKLLDRESLVPDEVTDITDTKQDF